MRKNLLVFLALIVISTTVHAQLSGIKNLGKTSVNHPWGWGFFAYYNFPLNETANRNLVIELLDLGYFPTKGEDDGMPDGYISIKAGYKYIFSEETATGFYAEPQLGWALVDNGTPVNKTHNGVAAAIEGGYALEVGQNANTLNFGVKYEADIAGQNQTINAVSLRVSYSFHLFRRRSD